MTQANFGRECKRIYKLLIMLFVLLLPGYAAALRIAVLPFSYPSQNNDLKEFADHASRSIRSAFLKIPNGNTLISDKEVDQYFANGKTPLNEGEAVKAASELQADLAIYGFLNLENNRYYMKAVMWEVDKDRASVATEHKVGNIHELPGVLELFINAVSRRLHGSPNLPFYRSETTGSTGQTTRLPKLVDVNKSTGPWRSPDLPVALSGLDMGNLVGERKNEIVFLDDGGITIGRYEAGGVKQLTQYSQFDATHLAVDVEDIDGDGIGEIILCYQLATGLESCIVKYANRNLQVLDRIQNVILRMIRNPANPEHRILVGQKTDLDDMFTGELTTFEVVNSKLRQSGSIHLPPGTLLLSYASGNLGKADQFVQAILDQDQRVHLFDAENNKLSSITHRLYGSDRKIKFPFKSGYRQIALPGRLVIGDIKSGEANELLVIKTGEMGSAIEALGWDESKLTEQWRTIRSNGIITDFRIGDFKNEGSKSLVLLLVKPGYFMFTAPQSVIFAYDVIP